MTIRIRDVIVDKKLTIIPLLLAIFFQPLNYGFATQSESRSAWGYWGEEITIEIYTPYQAYPSDFITIRVTVEAYENLTNASVRLQLHSSRYEGLCTWNYSIDFLNNQNLTAGTVYDQNLNISIPSDLSPGLIYSKVTCYWKVINGSSWVDRSTEDTFNLTYIMNKQYEELLANYNATLLELDYWQNQSNYWQNQSDYWQNQSTTGAYDSLAWELGITKYLMYVFIVTTVIFIVTTVYFAKKKQKEKRGFRYDPL